MLVPKTAQVDLKVRAEGLVEGTATRTPSAVVRGGSALFIFAYTPGAD